MRCPLWILGLVVPIVASAPTVRLARGADDAGVTAEEVRKSIERGVQFLKKLQDPQKGSWPDQPSYGGGATPLVTLALLNCGYGPEDEAVRKGLAYSRHPADHHLHLRAADHGVLRRRAETRSDSDPCNAKWLEEQQIKEGSRAGMWSYPKSGARIWAITRTPNWLCWDCTRPKGQTCR